MPPAKRPRSSSLQTIAPRDQFQPSTISPHRPPRTHVNVPRTRLPPRSRFGCWTCRTRKVKCDEARPECTPCARLGHLCDYNPRLSFKDDTPRVIRKISGRHGGQGPVWKPTGRSSSSLRSYDRYNDRSGFGSSWTSTEAVDTLGPFHTLTSDVDRERKALSRPPGTFNVVVNPTSFANFNEYKETFPGDPFPPVIATYGGPPANRVDTTFRAGRQPSPLASYNSLDNTNDEVEDENVVILKMFEDNDPECSVTSYLRHQTVSYSAAYSDTTTTSTSMAQSVPNPSSSGVSAQRGDIYSYSTDNTPLLRYAHPDGRDHSIIYYYKNFVHRHLAQVHRDTLGTSVETGALTAPDVLERHAGTFLPLYHALMAFSALSMSHKHGMPSLEALQHYQQALPLLQASLHTEDDLASDGVFLTHFILLLYEIAAGEVRGFSYWAHHIEQLLKITLLRRRLYGTEPYNFVVWWVANIDTHVVLTGMGGGQYIETVLRLKLLPTGIGSDLQHMPSSSLLSTEEPTHALPSSLAFHRRICFLAAELSILTRDIREEARKISPEQPNADTIDHWQRRIAKVQDNLRRTWNVQMPESHVHDADNHQLLPVGARGIFEHTYAMYRALLIYSHTSMYPSQMRYHKSYAIHEVSQSASEILQLGREIVNSGHMERKFIVFPLFMAGFAEKRPAERAETLNLLRKLEQDSIGRNFVATRHLLEMVFDRQNYSAEAGLGLNLGVRRPPDGRRRSTGDYQGGYEREWLDWSNSEPEDIDWVGMIGEMGLQVVSCRI